MDHILIVNRGSSSQKISVFKYDLAKVGKFSSFEEIKNFNITYIAHRIVHGGNLYFEPVIVTDDVIDNLKSFNKLAPLHNPYCLEGIEEAKKFFPKAINIAVFDTQFHAHMPEKASHYGIAKSYGLKRYGFHGIAHESLWKNYKGKGSNIITLHLGSGSSICAIKNGTSIDTSMGFTPLEGLVMITRSGDIDPSAIEYLAEKLQKPPIDILKILNFESGILGLSGTKKIEELPLDSFAVELFCYRIIKYIGSYIAALKGIDALIFSGGIGENCIKIRKKIIDELAYFGFFIEEATNQTIYDIMPGQTFKINSPISKEIWVTGADENRLIANKTLELMRL